MSWQLEQKLNDLTRKVEQKADSYKITDLENIIHRQADLITRLNSELSYEKQRVDDIQRKIDEIVADIISIKEPLK